MPGRVAKKLCVALFFSCALMALAADGPYKLKEGETLFSVARKAQVPVDVLSAYNGIADAAKVRAGTVIHLLKPYVVRKGDTLYSIARESSLSLAKLMELNKLAQDALIKVGDKLYVPAEAGGSATQTAQQHAPDTVQGSQGAGGSTLSGLVWPHGGRREPYNGKIGGLIFFGTQGDVVYSATSGYVKWVAPYWGYGKAIVIMSSDGVVCTYMGNREILVNVGDRVNPGTEIARLGESSQGGGAKLYFSMKDANGRMVDPEKFISAKGHA